MENFIFCAVTVTELASMEVLQLLLSNISEAILPISKCSGLFSFNSYTRGFHAYKQNWDPVLGRRYPCITDEKNEHDKHVIEVVNDDEVVCPFALVKDHAYVFKIDWLTHGSRSEWKVHQPRSRLRIRNTM